MDLLLVLDDSDSAHEESRKTSYPASNSSLQSDLLLSVMPVRDIEWVEQRKAFLRNAARDGLMVR